MCEMTTEMIKAAFELEKAALNFRKLYEQQRGKSPVIFIKNDETGNGVFIADGFNTELIKSYL